MPATGGATAAWSLITASGDGPPLDVPRVPAREAAERELSKPVYGEDERNLLLRAADAFFEWVGDLFDAASGATPGGWVGVVVITVIAVALLGALWWRLGTPRRAPASADPLFAEAPRTAGDHRAAAERYAAAGRWNQAVQERMRAVVRSLEERTVLDPRPGRTADEAAAEAGRALPAHADGLRAAAREFDDVTYGGRTADQHAYRRLKDLDAAVQRARPRWNDRPREAAR
ncbi:DUF4129 domain-containing protein [Streptomyces somaliensis DSM 40738]|uniref:DUF4129 domain-containing protein n=1 Tax=Streptomyces somaliensis (strain ATCC 33201 / DSM 40738 / JCM 12659 / KCTC 9044 / NCTC 11332 / NRRL B-12077 / IP 733) TaxID=1134445 RepID=A0AA44DET7_STRE0|nr:DUF4129 domain-containing protein [Streptomyces somaliensis]MCQ0022955.1 DUF4129 domain-containing protein [Streptomyces somaliensis DSM 40738]NKY14922.1 DUF4129 domain-containing protein [Streptomyces somaliensis DSM 40738]